MASFINVAQKNALCAEERGTGYPGYPRPNLSEFNFTAAATWPGPALVPYLDP